MAAAGRRGGRQGEGGLSTVLGGGGGAAKTVERPAHQPPQPPVRQLLGPANAQTAPATSSTAPAHQPLGSANAETTPAGAPAAATRRNMRREERVTVQGPEKKQRPDGMAHGGQ